LHLHFNGNQDIWKGLNYEPLQPASILKNARKYESQTAEFKLCIMY